jgi:hypothetical protein
MMVIDNSRHVRGPRLLLVVVALSLPYLSLACYNPSISNGGLLCAEAGKACPDGFECNATDRRCYATVKCSVAAVTPICQDGPKAGAACNPTCQIGCACGRCNVFGANPVCTTSIGSAQLGQICTPGAKDNCAAGLICLLESCGSNLGRCYQHCTTSAQCSGGRACEVPILDGSTGRDTGYRTCSLAPQSCNPVATTGNGCPSPSLGCYLDTDGTTFCDCSNSTPPLVLGGLCVSYNDCASNLVCATSAGVAGAHCRQACTVASSTCPSGQRCIAEGSTYGYCGT